MRARIGRPSARRLHAALKEPTCPGKTQRGYNVDKWVVWYEARFPAKPERNSIGEGLVPPITWKDELDRQRARQVEIDNRKAIGELVEWEIVADLFEVFAVELNAQLDQALIDAAKDFPAGKKTKAKQKLRKRFDQCLDSLSDLLEDIASLQEEPADSSSDALESADRSNDSDMNSGSRTTSSSRQPSAQTPVPTSSKAGSNTGSESSKRSRTRKSKKSS